MSKLSKPSRRQFLTASAAAVVAPTVMPSSVFGGPAQPPPSDRVVVGVIGTGDLGRKHHLNNKLLPNARVQVAAVCDVDRNHRDQAALDVFAKTGKRIAAYKDFRDLCDVTGAKMDRAVAFNAWGTPLRFNAPWWFWNLFGEQAVFLLSRKGR